MTAKPKPPREAWFVFDDEIYNWNHYWTREEMEERSKADAEFGISHPVRYVLADDAKSKRKRKAGKR